MKRGRGLSVYAGAAGIAYVCGRRSCKCSGHRAAGLATNTRQIMLPFKVQSGEYGLKFVLRADGLKTMISCSYS